MSQRINHLLNKKKLVIEDIERIFNWNPNELMRLMVSSHNGSILKYDPNVNDFTLLNAERFTRQGPQGITGGKNIGDEFRDIYPSHIGRFDLNAISHGGNSCLTGFLTHKCKVYKDGFFSKKSNDPDEFPDKLRTLRKLVKNKKIDKRIAELNATVKHDQIIRRLKVKNKQPLEISENGRYIVTRRKSLMVNLDKNTYMIPPRNASLNSSKAPAYRDENGLWRNENGRYVIDRRHNAAVNKNGRYVIDQRYPEDHYLHVNERNRYIIPKRRVET